MAAWLQQRSLAPPLSLAWRETFMIQESSSHLNAERIEGLPKQWSMMLQFQSLSQTQLGNTRHLTPASKCLQSSLEILRRFSGNLACVLLRRLDDGNLNWIEPVMLATAPPGVGIGLSTRQHWSNSCVGYGARVSNRAETVWARRTGRGVSIKGRPHTNTRKEYSKKVSETFINISRKLILRTNHYFESLPTTPAQSPTLPRDHKSSNRFGLEKHGHPLEKRRWNVLKSDLEREKWHRFRWSDGLQMGCTLSEMILRIL